MLNNPSPSLKVSQQLAHAGGRLSRAARVLTRLPAMLPLTRRPTQKARTWQGPPTIQPTQIDSCESTPPLHKSPRPFSPFPPTHQSHPFCSRSSLLHSFVPDQARPMQLTILASLSWPSCSAPRWSRATGRPPCLVLFEGVKRDARVRVSQGPVDRDWHGPPWAGAFDRLIRLKHGHYRPPRPLASRLP